MQDGDTGGLLASPVATHDTNWDPASVKVTLNVTLDAMIVPDASGGARVDTAHLAVLDGFIGEEERAELLDFITQPGWDHARGPPPSKWERATRDRADAAATWGLKDEWLRALRQQPLRAKLEVQSRLARLYPEYVIAHMPSDAIQVQRRGAGGHGEPGLQRGQGEEQGEEQGEKQERDPGPRTDDQPAGQQLPGGGQGGGQEPLPCAGQSSLGEGCGHGRRGPAATSSQGAAGGEGQGGGDDGSGEEGEEAPSGHPIVDCNQFVANAAVHGDTYAWHVDADPSTLPYPSPWTLEHGQYINREPGRPLFVSLLLYLNRSWERHWDAETLFLDTQSDCGVVVRPQAYRAVLLDQDVLHRLSMPSRDAGLPRYSLVWKLVFLPRTPDQRVCLARPEWGRPSSFGSAAALDKVVQGVAAANRRKRRVGEEGRE